MSDPAHLANELVFLTFDPYFGDRLPRNLGLEAFAVVFRRLQREGLRGHEHTEDVVSCAVLHCYRYLETHGGQSVAHPRAWFHLVCRHESTRYLRDRALRDSLVLTSVVEGLIELPGVQAWNEERMVRALRASMRSLSPRHREFLHLDLIESRSHDEIQERMKIRSHAYFKKLKCEAFKALRQALMVVINKGIDALL